MNSDVKLVETLTVADIKAHPVWRYLNNDELGETAVRPVKRIPVANLVNRIIGTEVCLANGTSVWATICNVDGKNARKNEHFLTIAIERGGKWFHLARYHDIDSDTRGPEALAQFLGLEVSQVFPISYDITRYAKGNAAALCGTIPHEPREKLT